MSTVDTFDARSVKHENTFEQAAAEIFGSTRNADTALEGATLTIAREPQNRSVAVSGGGRAIKTESSAFWPSVVVIFKYDTQSVTLLAIFRADPDGR